MNTKLLSCPVCSLKLLPLKLCLKCENGHSFDLSSKGYANLLMSQDKHSKDPGDSKEMVLARKRFLEKGFYASLASQVAQTILEIIQKKHRPYHPITILDAGCGMGYYTHFIDAALNKAGISANLVGMDISKDAIKVASIKNRGPDFCVASLFKLPIMDKSVDIIINAFAPASDSEFRRVLMDGGSLIGVIPGKMHLYTLKTILYDTPYENDEAEPDLPSFQVQQRKRVSGEITLSDNPTVLDLLSMTPYYWRTPEEGVNRLKKIDSLKTAIEFIILVSN